MSSNIGRSELLGAALSPITPFTMMEAALISLALTALGFLGGLMLSAQKRERGIKDWGKAIQGTRAHGDRVGWPTLPDDQLPGPARYLREHSVQQIGARLAGGVVQMASDLWSGFWVVKFATLAVLLTVVSVWPRRTLLVALVTHESFRFVAKPEVLP